MSSISNAVSGATERIGKFLSIPDKNPRLRVIYDIGLMAIGVGAIALGIYLSGGLSFQNFSPTYQTMILGAGMVAVGTGASWLLEDTIGKPSKNSLIRKIMIVAIPILFMAATAGVGYLAFYHTGSNAPLSPFFVPFLMMAPGVPYTVGLAFERLEDSKKKKIKQKRVNQQQKVAIQKTQTKKGQDDLISFYKGGTITKGLKKGWTLQGMQDYFGNGGKSEYTFETADSHRLIQWLFPLQKPSRYNPNAPLLTAQQIQAFRNDKMLQYRVQQSFLAMMSYYGLLSLGDRIIIDKETWQDRKGFWFTHDNHNFLRITRIIKFLSLIGMEEQAHAFYHFLAELSKEGTAPFSRDNLDQWHRALGQI